MLLNFALAILSGLLLVLVHPRFNLVWLAPVALAPLILALAREGRPKYRLLLGYVTGMIFWGGVCYWIEHVMAVYGNLGTLGGSGVFLLFCLVPSLNMAWFGLLGGTVVRKPYALPALAALWVALERIPSPFGFMWLKLGNAGTDMSIPMRLAPILGVYGLSYMFAIMSAGVSLVFLRRSRVHLAWLACLLAIYLCPGLPAVQQGLQVAAVVQPNLDENKEYTQAEVESLEKRLARLSLDAAMSHPSGVGLILWPEAPAPLYYYNDPDLRERIHELTRATKASVLINTVSRTAKDEPLNSAVLISAQGQLAGRYDKVSLVPFGEYVPEPFGFANKISTEIGNFVPGERVAPLPGGLGVFICYESAFPHLVRKFAIQGATFLVNLSNDGYFGNSAAREQHLKLVRMRAAENRRWILRSTNDGITAAIDPAGRVLEQFPQFQEFSGRLRYSSIQETSFYTRHGDWFAWACAFLGALFVILAQLPDSISIGDLLRMVNPKS